MKRLFILFTLAAFLVASCAGSNKEVRLFTKPDFNQEEYEKDQEECNEQSLEKSQDSDARWQTFVDCFAKKGYIFTITHDELKWKPSFDEEAFLTLINPLFWADVILSIPVVLTIRLIDQLKPKESPKQDQEG